MDNTPVIPPADGKVGVLLPGFGAVATTVVAGVEAVRQGLAQPFGSLTQMNTVRLGKRTEERTPLIRDLVDIAGLDQLVFGAWDPIPDDGYESAVNAGVLDRTAHLDPIRGFLESVKPMPAVFDTAYVKRLDGPNRKTGANRMELADALRDDIRRFKAENGCARAVMIWCGSTEVFQRSGPAHATVEAFERAMREDDPAIAPSMIYAYAAIMEGVPYANGAPNLSADVPALEALARERGVPIAGKDFKTGQTLMKTILAPGLKARMLGVSGWFSTNILGNRDGEVLDDPESFKTKEESKLGVLEYILQPEMYPELYGEIYHKVRINYYPPRGDDKEGWDNLDIFGWLGYPMQIKVDFLCRDSILAAPIVLDLALFLDLAGRAGMGGIQEWLSFYFKSPHTPEGLYPEHDLFIQHKKLKNTLRWLAGEEQITHLGREYYA
ncbi:MAG: inositol-3-phosphate synthase [Gemmatimonadetes bacterium]|nr:inositol-3-phosphate synthase [Gemmatimonadota bacterium]MYA65409.1 inositol-3-phosphate synthase [Gemmatimonadota bacterium]MYB97337.1 inositol-3-phosphate synthase [Gemmatimonadota bacterium]MYH51935.1 inositol-3-phosphate synthase [Gemmatimonadota bacterium]MYI47277.1 inositol-3-phosphate synthase [Gemmatimonadota bacterium]